MSNPIVTLPDVEFPAPNIGATHIECAAGSQRDPDESLAQPCHVCGHFACRIGPHGPIPCETCGLTVYVRTVAGNIVGGAADVVGQLRTQVANLTRRVDELEGRVYRASSFPI